MIASELDAARLWRVALAASALLMAAVGVQAAPAAGKPPPIAATFGVCDMVDGTEPNAEVVFAGLFDHLRRLGVAERDWDRADVVIQRQPGPGALLKTGSISFRLQLPARWPDLMSKDGWLRLDAVALMSAGDRSFQVNVRLFVAYGYTPDAEEGVCPRRQWRVSRAPGQLQPLAGRVA